MKKITMKCDFKSNIKQNKTWIMSSKNQPAEMQTKRSEMAAKRQHESRRNRQNLMQSSQEAVGLLRCNVSLGILDQQPYTPQSLTPIKNILHTGMLRQIETTLLKPNCLNSGKLVMARLTTTLWQTYDLQKIQLTPKRRKQSDILH